MDKPSLISDLLGNIPELTSRNSEWTGWFALNADVNRMPIDAEFFTEYDIDARDLRKEPTTVSGRLIDIDWGCDVDWNRHRYPWRCINPIKDPEGILPCPPFLDFDEVAPFIREQIDRPYYIENDYARAMEERCHHLDGLVSEVAMADMWNGDRFVRPPIYHAMGLSSAHFSCEDDLQREVANCRRAIADRMGWLSWVISCVPMKILKDRVDSYILKQVMEVTSVRYSRRGVIMRLSLCWSEVNIPLWLTHEVPIFYSWNFEERLMPQLVKVNPRLIANDSSEGKVSLHYVEVDDDLKSMTRDLHLYDEFFQPVTFSDPSGHLAFESDATLYVIDFQFWKRRPLPQDVNPGEYMSRFYFRVDSGDEEESPVVTFWRWRKKPNAPMEKFGSSCPAEFDEMFIRELFKTEYAPHDRFEYHEETGLRTGSADSSVNLEPEHLPSFYDEIGKSESSDSGEEEMEDMSPIEVEEPATSSSLMARLGMIPFPVEDNQEEATDHQATPCHYERVGNITSWRNAACREEELNRGIERGRQAGTRNDRYNDRRSRSPRHSLAREIPPRIRPLSLFRDKLRRMASCFTYDQRLYPITMTLTWNPTLLNKGILILPDPRAEVRLRYFANCVMSDVRHTGTLLSLAIEHRFSFRIAIKKSDIVSFKPRQLSQTIRTMGAALYDTNYRESHFTYSTPTGLFANYVSRVADLLNRPHSAAFIGLGGACSWLAHRWGGDDILRRFMFGPSIQTTVFERGASDIKSAVPMGLVWDDISAQDLEILFGYVPHPSDDRRHDRWLYPPPHILEDYCVNWTGEWNKVMETMFRHITNRLFETPCTWDPKSRGGWKSWLRTYNNGRYKPLHSLTQDFVDDIFQGLELAKLPRTWDGKPLRLIDIPESTV